MCFAQTVYKQYDLFWFFKQYKKVISISFVIDWFERFFDSFVII